ncbi:hypothetical protein OIO90_005996 [Microbotryomycetes sp. JL221]|nr:hypothetical protein OIO90_005996 [Microbotryomycetes sp. JL221]
MASTDSNLLSFSRAAGTVGLGIAAGYLTGISASTMPVLFSIDTLAPRDRLHFWSKTYDVGKSHMAPTFFLTSALFSYSTYAAIAPATWAPANWIARHRKYVLGACAASALFNVVFTVAAMGKTIKAGKSAEAKIIKDASTGNGQEETDYIIQDWASLHTVRTVNTIIAFVLAVAELVSV